MMPITSTMTSKGQTTIPQQIRLYLGLHAGDRLEFIINESGQVMVIPCTSDIRALKGILGKPKKRVTLEQMKQAIKQRGGHDDRS